MTAPRVFLMRHGETEWSKEGRNTGNTDLQLTKKGVKNIIHTKAKLVGEDRLIQPSHLKHIYVSPRRRAQETLDLLDLHTQAGVEVTQDIREWNYGGYEGLTLKAVSKIRNKDGHGSWLIWRDGCPGGESPEEISERLDRLIHDIRKRFHVDEPGKALNKEATDSDVLVVGHGHILRAFSMRWCNKQLSDSPSPEIPTGWIETLSYEDFNLNKPIVLSDARSHHHAHH